MYESFFGLREKPFSLVPDPAFLFFARHHRRALLQLEFGLANQAAFLLITGEVGSGKTTLIQYLLGTLSQDHTVGVVTNTTPYADKVMRWVCSAFRLEARGLDDAELYQTFADFLEREHAAGRRVLLVVDEAQNLGPERLEELRVLSNLNVGKKLMLQTILVGQPELRKLLQAPKFRQFAQRIGAEYHVGRLTAVESAEYVAHRLRVAGCERADVFESAAIGLAHETSGGIPRLLNQICDTALVYGYAEERGTIDAALMLDAINDRCEGGIFPGRIPGARKARGRRSAAVDETGGAA
jgi:type II secretory pathway predicted ATPase ExeA